MSCCTSASDLPASLRRLWHQLVEAALYTGHQTSGGDWGASRGYISYFTSVSDIYPNLEHIQIVGIHRGGSHLILLTRRFEVVTAVFHQLLKIFLQKGRYVGGIQTFVCL